MAADGFRGFGKILALVAVGLWVGATMARGAEDGLREEPRKPAWKWSVEERLAARFDPEALEARAARHRAEYEELKEREPELFAHAGPPREDLDSIDGAETPELFLPWELFSHLLELGFAPEEGDLSDSRGSIGERAVALGLGHDLWQRLENAAFPLLQLRRDQFRRAMEARSRGEKVQGPDAGDVAFFCRTRAEAFAVARAEFGEEPLLRLLYEVVAPSMGKTYVVDEGSREQLRFVEGGCR